MGLVDLIKQLFFSDTILNPHLTDENKGPIEALGGGSVVLYDPETNNIYFRKETLGDWYKIEPKPEVKFPESIEGTDLIEGVVGEGMTLIYDSHTNNVLFGGAGPDLWYLGRLDGKHIAARQENIYGKKKTLLVDENGKALFGGLFDSESLTLINSRSDQNIDLHLNDLGFFSLRNRLKGDEDTLVELVSEGAFKGKLNFYGIDGRAILEGIPAFSYKKTDKKDDNYFCENGELRYLATSCFFGKIDDQTLFEIAYGPHSKLYQLPDSRSP